MVKRAHVLRQRVRVCVCVRERERGEERSQTGVLRKAGGASATGRQKDANMQREKENRREKQESLEAEKLAREH
eukprot:1395323-Amorphochlora_amoeboformis.AAC.1